MSFFGSSTSSSGGGSMFGGDSGSSSSSIIPGFQDESACSKICPNLTLKQRVIGFLGCATLGWVLSFIGTLTLIGGTTPKNLRTFVVLYVIGNVIALCATGFLLGPKSQCTKMWHPCRRFTTAFYLLMLIVVLVVAITKQNIILIFFLLFIEILAAVWYGLSYIPYGRAMVLGFFRQTGICMPCFAVSDAIHEQYKEMKSSNSSSSSSGGGMFGGKK